MVLVAPRCGICLEQRAPTGDLRQRIAHLIVHPQRVEQQLDDRGIGRIGGVRRKESHQDADGLAVEILQLAALAIDTTACLERRHVTRDPRLEQRGDGGHGGGGGRITSHARQR